MSLNIDRHLLEQIEALQNLMLASVTGGARDDTEYRQLRDGLFNIPGIKEALPRFVRTCGDLSQFWHFIKIQAKLGSYGSRREYIWNAFRPLLSGVDDQSDIDRETFIVKGTDHDAYVHIRAILQTAEANLFVIDPYMDGSIYQVLGTLASRPMAIKILTSKCPTDFTLENKKFMKQHSGLAIEVRTTKDFHDRYVILDQARCYLLGASIKDAGNRGFTIVPLHEPSTVEFILNHANRVWESATIL